MTASSLGGMDSLEIGVAADSVALIQFSSGTTHDPKPVALTHANLLSNLASIERYLTTREHRSWSASHGCRSTTTWD